MKIEELVPLTNGLSVTACGQTLVCDRARVAAAGGAVEMKFLIAGTDFVPRLRLSEQRVVRGTAEEIARLLRRVVKRAVGCER